MAPLFKLPYSVQVYKLAYIVAKKLSTIVSYDHNLATELSKVPGGVKEVGEVGRVVLGEEGWLEGGEVAQDDPVPARHH